ncbi:peptidoglycan recognition family protein [Micromonospora sp. WMMD956]|uniref:peptidoglycan recognition protein family protein n=1 Tax=Micromonospora sp. WMMD956 TaxID=3016108 RepID=UPI002416F262|nr:peptidoglycan recognition family protein [Micromonospora sp. WMMD956]MDG4813912.1 peptidoglycan recognition family protein [Micromonospora sp. WMMD956]
MNSGNGTGKPDEPADRLDAHHGVVVHIAAGYFDGTITWQRNPASRVSSHFIVAKDGRIAQMVDTDIRAWTQRAGNRTWLSIENEGFLPDPLTPPQLESNAQLLARAHTEHGVRLQIASSPDGRGLGHHSMGAENGYDWGHSQCPGPAIVAQKPAIVARAKQIVEGDDVISEEDLRRIAIAVNGWIYPKDGPALHTAARGAAADAARAVRDVATLRVEVREALGRDWVDEDAIIAGVLTGLAARPPEEAATALVAVLGEERAAALGRALLATN